MLDSKIQNATNEHQVIAETRLGWLSIYEMTRFMVLMMILAWVLKADEEVKELGKQKK